MDPTITGIQDHTGAVQLQGDHYCVSPGVVIAQGTTGFDPEDEGEEIGITANITKPGGIAQVVPPDEITFGSTDAQGSRNFAARWQNYMFTGGGQTLKVKQATSPFGETTVMLNVH